MKIHHSNDPQEIVYMLDEGYEPIECSIGGRSIVGDLEMDHHGDLSHLTGVAIRAYENYGARKDDPSFVVTGAADADATFAIAALAGLLPHPSNADLIEGKPWLAGLDADLSELAVLINLVDTAPIGVRLEEKGDDGAKLLLFNQTSSSSQDAMSFYSGVDRWRWLTKSPSEALLRAALDAEAERVAAARNVEKIAHAGKNVAVIKSPVWGFDVWYSEFAPIIVALAPNGNITLGVSDKETAEQYLGEGGLKNIFPQLAPEGWGGREAIGGSPRGMKMSWEDALAAAEVVVAAIKQ